MSEKETTNSGVPTVLNPYRDTALLYRDAWFKGPLPLPYKAKETPPIDYNKRISKYPTLEVIENWRSGKSADGKNPLAGGPRHNICVRLAGVDAEHEMIGIDVDDYIKRGEKKNGWSQLKALEDKLGPLPETWISSARTDGRSGIRYFRVPRGLAFRGKVDKDIEVIRKGHRYAVVWPSIHPDGGTYWWFPPETLPDKQGRGRWDGILPVAKEFALLPEPWIDYLTSHRTLAVDDELIDVDSSVDEIYDWATDTFHGEDGTEPCSLMRKKLDIHISKIQKATALHDLLTNAHWNILHLAFEGHLGWNKAVNELEKAFVDKVVKDGGSTDRDNHTLVGEIFRSRIQALRRIKGKVDDRTKIGATAVDPDCTKIGLCGSGSSTDGGSKISGAVASLAGSPGDDSNSTDSSVSGDNGPPGELDDIPKGATKGVPEYRTNDDGNGQHFFDMFSNISIGSSVRYAEGYGWIVWHEGQRSKDGSFLRQPRWERDENSDQLMRRMWQVVRDRQESYVEACFADFQTKTKDFLKGAPGVSETDVKVAKAVYEKWNRFSENSGNNRQAENAIKAVRSIAGVSISVNQLDQNPYLLGVANGVIELDDSENLRLRPARPDDYITLNTNVSWEEPTNFAKAKWQEYLDTFLPDPELQRITQIAMGHTLVGGNPEKILIVLKGDPNTGKSTMCTAVETALGDYAQSVSHTIFQNHKLNPVLANAIPKRIIVCSEFDEKDALSASMVKRLTGGSDRIQAELKGSNTTVEGIPQFVPILATNEVPTISGADKALQNRLFVIPFHVTPSQIDKSMSVVIEKVCATAVLTWLIEGYRQYRELGKLPISQEIEKETRDFVAQLDEVATFADECIVSATSPEQYVSRKDMYDRFCRWWMENQFSNNLKPSMPKFTRRMKALGFKTKDTRFRGTNGKLEHWWIGIKLEKQTNVISMPNFVSEKTETKSETETPKNGS